jgi:peptide/nickel transport system permease protein
MAVAEPTVSPLLVPPRQRVARWARLGHLERGGLIILGVTTLVAVAAPLLAPHSPTAPLPVGPFVAPGHGAVLGTDDLARDILSRVLYGIRASWVSALVVIASGVVIGGGIGLVAGAAGGRIDAVLMRVTDLFLALPAAILAIAVIAALGPSLPHTLLAVGIVWWPWYARIVRAEVVRAHVDAARLAGVRRVRLAMRHLLPGAIPAVLVTASLDVGNLVLTLAALSFIGLGSPPPAPELGAMVARGMPYLLGHPWIPLFPAVAVFILAFAANLAGDGVRDLLEH